MTDILQYYPFQMEKLKMKVPIDLEIFPPLEG